MPSWGTLIRRDMATPGVTGSNARRIAEGVTHVDGVAVAGLGTRGSWWRRLTVASGETAGRGGSANRLGGGVGLRALYEQNLLTGAAGDRVLAEDGVRIALEDSESLETE